MVCRLKTSVLEKKVLRLCASWQTHTTSNNYPSSCYIWWLQFMESHTQFRVRSPVAQLCCTFFNKNYLLFASVSGKAIQAHTCNVSIPSAAQRCCDISLGFFFCIADQLIIIVQMQIEFLSPFFPQQFHVLTS